MYDLHPIFFQLDRSIRSFFQKHIICSLTSIFSKMEWQFELMQVKKQFTIIVADHNYLYENLSSTIPKDMTFTVFSEQGQN